MGNVYVCGCVAACMLHVGLMNLSVGWKDVVEVTVVAMSVGMCAFRVYEIARACMGVRCVV